MHKKKVLLLNMPFGALERQALGISLLKAALVAKKIPCDIKYLSFTLAELIGPDDYYWISNDLPHTAFVGEWVFTGALFGTDLIPISRKNYTKEILKDDWRLDESSIARILNVRNMVHHFLNYCMETIRWEKYAIVGFTSTFEQNLSSLALAKRIKETDPRIKIVFGGGNWEGEMGEELHRRFPFVDYACTGEADKSFPALVEQIFSGHLSKKTIAKTKGIVYRSDGNTVFTGPADVICELDELPFPDYSDYFSDLDKTSAADAVLPNLLIETSRGCWWGSKQHCTFCGLNGRTLRFRSKTPARAREEVDHFVGCWKFDMIQAVDNVIDMSYFKDFLPAMADRDLTFFYEVRSNLTRKQVEILRDAGVNHVQPGIESLSDHVLKLMRKGTTALKNIQVLKWFKEHGISAGWNFLYGFPGETGEDYGNVLNILPSIRFLEPPTGCGPVRLDRFSPYFNHRKRYGLKNVRPIASYKYLYPFPENSLKKIAYYFDYNYKADPDPNGYLAAAIEFVQDWQKNPDPGTLKCLPRKNDRLALIDTRACAVRRHFMLAGIDREVYEYCDSVRSCIAIVRHLKKVYRKAFTEKQVRKFLNALVANKLMVTDGKRFLSLAMRS